MKRRSIKRSGSGDHFKRPKLVIGKPGSRSRSRSRISRSSKHGSPKGSKKPSRESLLSGGEISTVLNKPTTLSICDPQLRQIVKTQQAQDKSQPGLALCCHWKHCPTHQKILKQHLITYRDYFIPIYTYHGKGCDGKKCLEVTSKTEVTAARQKHSPKAHDRIQVDTTKKSLDITQGPSCHKLPPVRPRRKRPSKPTSAWKDLVIPEVDISSMRGEHLRRAPLKLGGKKALQTPTRKTLHVVKVEVHYDESPVKPTKPEHKPSPQPPQTQKEDDVIHPDLVLRRNGKRFFGRPFGSIIPFPVETTKPEQKPAALQHSPSPGSGADEDTPTVFYDSYYCPPSTSKETPVLKKKSPNRKLGTSTKLEENSDPEIEDMLFASGSGTGNWIKLYREWSAGALSSLKAWFQGKKKMTILAEGADSSAPPLKKIRLCPPGREPALKSYRSMATPIDAVAPWSLQSPTKPPVVRKSLLLPRKSIPFHKTSEFKFMLDLQDKFNLQEDMKIEILDSSNVSEDMLPEGQRISVMLNGYGGLVDTHKAHSPDDSSPNTEGVSPVATLCNLGNTCFLNSVLYTLRFAPHFMHNLHHLATDLVDLSGRYSHLKTKSSSLGRGIGGGSKSWSNKDLSTMGQGTTQEDKIALATLRLHELYEALHNAELKDQIEPYQPEIFLTALREVNSIFEGNQQHDAHELLVCLLDIIRETCRQLSQLNERQRCIIPQPPPPSCPLPPAKSSFSSNVRKSLKLGKTKTNGVLDKKNTLSATKLGKIIVPCCEVMAGPASEPQPCPDSVPTNKPKPGKSLPEPNYLHLSESIKKKIKAREATSKTNVAGEPQQSDGPLICDQALGQNEEEGPRVGHNFIAEDFEGLMHLYTTCLECEKTSERPESFIDICVPITPPSGSCVTAEEMSALYHSAIVTEEYLQDANKYWCEFCGRYNEARRNVSFDSLPRLLILQLKRFSSSFGSCVQKLNEFMPTPLLLSCFCKKCKDLEEHRKPHLGYQLYGIIMHLGSTMASGHYVTYVCGRDTVTDCTNCTRDKRKTASLSGGAGKPAANSVVERHGLFRFFKSSKPSYPSALDSRSAYYPPCRSADCCGVKLDSNEPVWLECDDDTVRTISRKQLEELLGPKTTKNAALTPYLLFYSRIQ